MAGDSRYPMPASIVLIATPEGWRHSVLDTWGGMLCGRLAQIAADASPERARAAAVAMLRDVAREYHDTEIEVVWNGQEPEEMLTAQVISLRHRP
ncbi:hypothetical protein [Nocardia sp. NPDC004750]